MDNATDKNPLIDDHPSDTLNMCAGVVAFLRNATLSRIEAGENAPQIEGAEEGYYAILRCLEGALRYETENTGRAVRPDLKAVTNG